MRGRRRRRRDRDRALFRRHRPPGAAARERRPRLRRRDPGALRGGQRRPGLLRSRRLPAALFRWHDQPLGGPLPAARPARLRAPAGGGAQRLADPAREPRPALCARAKALPARALRLPARILAPARRGGAAVRSGQADHRSVAIQPADPVRGGLPGNAEPGRQSAGRAQRQSGGHRDRGRRRRGPGPPGGDACGQAFAGARAGVCAGLRRAREPASAARRQPRGQRRARQPARQCRPLLHGAPASARRQVAGRRAGSDRVLQL